MFIFASNPVLMGTWLVLSPLK